MKCVVLGLARAGYSSIKAPRMFAFTPARPSRWLQAVFVAMIGVLAAALLFNRVSWGDWSRPHWLEGDPLEVYARVKIAAEQPARALLHFDPGRLGAPDRADWSAYPVPDRLVFVLAGLLSHIVGLIAAINAVSALFAGLSAATFYLCARWLRCRWEWAAALGLVFAFCNYNVRWGITLSLSQTFTLPPLVLLCAWASRHGRPVKPNRPWIILAVALGLWLGLGNPYLTYFAGVVAGGALLLALARRSPWSRKIPLVFFLGSLVVCFIACHAGYIGERLRGATTGALARSPGDFQVYALRPVEWLVPPADHRVPAFAEIGRKYFSSRHGTGEFFYNYLGVPGVVGLAGLLIVTFRRGVRRQWHRFDPVLGLAWITAFGCNGGINSWLGAVGFELFRASTRIGIFAEIWVLFFLCGWLCRRRLARPVALLGAALLALGSVWEGTPPLRDRAVGERNLARWHLAEKITTDLERTRPAGAAIFQLPAVPFPEAGPTGGMPDYEHLLPYLTSTSLRFSYGHLRHAPALRWARHVGRLPAAEMATELEQAGFSALWLDQRAYAGHAQALIDALHASGRAELFPGEPAFPVRIFRLNAAPQPQTPDYADPRLREPWFDEASPAGKPSLLALEGWFPPEQHGADRWRWATREAALGLWREGPATRAKLRFRLGGPGGNGVALVQQGREIQRFRAGPEIQEIEISLAPGLTTLEWRLTGPTFKPGGADPRELGFMVENLSVSVP
jgi:phosphoglycerol transferase